MSATDPADALQAGVYELLSSDATLTGLVTGVYDGVPEDEELDYVVLGTMTSSPSGDHDAEGRETVLDIDSWTRAEGFKTANTIGARIVALLWHRNAELDAVTDGHRVWRVEHEFAQTLRDIEPGVRRRVDRFRVWTKEDAA